MDAWTQSLLIAYSQIRGYEEQEVEAERTKAMATMMGAKVV